MDYIEPQEKQKAHQFIEQKLVNDNLNEWHRQCFLANNKHN